MVSLHGSGESVGSFLLRALRHFPVFGDVAQGEEEQLRGDIISGEVPAILHDLAQAQAHVQAIDGVGGVDDPARLVGMAEERGSPWATAGARLGRSGNCLKFCVSAARP